MVRSADEGQQARNSCPELRIFFLLASHGTLFHGHILNSNRKKPVPSVELELSPPPPPLPIRPADFQQIVGDSIREALNPLLEPLTALTPFLKSLQIGKVSKDHKPETVARTFI